MSRQGVFLTVIVLLTAMFGNAAWAAADAQVRLVPPEDTQAWAGESVAFDIELLVVGQFAGAAVFELPDAENVIVMQVSKRPLIGSRSLNRKTWTSQTHSFAAYSQRGGSIIIPPVTVRFGSKESWDAAVRTHNLKTDSLVLAIKVPPGAEGLVAAASGLQITQTWQPEQVKDLRVGDSVRRTVSMEAENFPAMLLPFAVFSAPQGVSIYPDEPHINDVSERGSVLAQRVDSASFVFEHAGEVTLPAVSIQWWNPDREEWRVREFEARTFSVAEYTAFSGDKQAAAPASASKGYLTWGMALMLAVFVLILSLMIWLYRQRTAVSGPETQSEKSQFEALRKSIRNDKAAEVYANSKAWLDCCGVTDMRSEVYGEVGQRLQQSLEELQSVLIGVNSDWDRSSMDKLLVEFRSQLGDKGMSAKPAALMAQLNPAVQS